MTNVRSSVAWGDSPTKIAGTNPQAIVGEEARAWFETLSPDRQAAIVALKQQRPLWNLLALVFLTMWIGAATLMVAFPLWPVRLAGYAIVGCAIHGFWNLMHKGAHGNLFHRGKLDKWVAFVMGLPTLFSAYAYGTMHRQHHLHNRTRNDPNELTNITANARLLSLIFYLIIVIGTPLAIVMLPFTALALADRREQRLILVEYAAMALIYTWLVALAVRNGYLTHLIHIWVIPLLFASFFGNVRGWSEHALTPAGHPLTQTRTITSNRLVSLLFTNANYHLEHHLFPGIPWYQLPRLHQLLQDEYRAFGVYNYRSYLKYVWDAARIGVHGFAPEPNGCVSASKRSDK